MLRRSMNPVRHSRSLTLGLAAVTLLLPSLGQSASVDLVRDTVIPVVVENQLVLGKVKEGDLFTAHVDENRDLPFHTRLIGRIIRITADRDANQTKVDMEFTDVILPDGSRHRIDAVPVSLDDKYVTRRGDGRMVVKADEGRQAGYVAGGLIGGFIIGSIIHKQAEASLLGLLGGALAATFDKRDVIFKKGQRVGALIERDQHFETYRPTGSRWDREAGRDDPRDRRVDRVGPDPIRPDAPIVTDVRINYDGMDLKFDDSARPYTEGKVVMVPLQATAKQLSLNVDGNPGRPIYVDGEDSTLRIDPSSGEVRLNGRKIDSPSPVVTKADQVYVPVDLFTTLKKGNLSVNGNRVRIQTS